MRGQYGDPLCLHTASSALFIAVRRLSRPRRGRYCGLPYPRLHIDHKFCPLSGLQRFALRANNGRPVIA